MPNEAREQSQYVNVAGELGLPTIEGYFDPKLFREVRAAYLARTPTASTPELTAKFRGWAATLWTWSDQPEAFPMGWRRFVKLVDKGVDLTIENAAVRGLERDVMIPDDCPTNPTLPKRKSCTEATAQLSMQRSARRLFSREIRGAQRARADAIVSPQSSRAESVTPLAVLTSSSRAGTKSLN